MFKNNYHFMHDQNNTFNYSDTTNDIETIFYHLGITFYWWIHEFELFLENFYFIIIFI